MSHAVRLPCDEAAIRCEPGPVAGTRTAGTWVLAATIIGSSLAFIDGTVVTVALPAIAREFDATGSEVQWVVEAYALFLSALLLVGGALGDRYGRRRVYALGIILFTIASVVCAFAPSIRWLILARAVQGVGGALLVPGALALISASFEPARRGQGDRHLVRIQRHHGRDRPFGRRLAGESLLALGVPSQRPARGGGPAAPAPNPRESKPARPPS